MSKNKFVRFDIGKFPLLGVVCSTNQLPGQGPSTAI